MFDIRWIREEPDAFDAALKRRGLEPLSPAILALDARRREAQTALQTMQTRRNEASKAIGEAKRKGEDAAAAMAEVAGLKWLIPTAEVPLTNLVRESIVAEDELPLRFTALTPCFRSEAGAAGRTRAACSASTSSTRSNWSRSPRPSNRRTSTSACSACAEEVLKRLDLPYRVMTLSTGDMGFAAQKTYDIEVWLPGQGPIARFRRARSAATSRPAAWRRATARREGRQGQGPRLRAHAQRLRRRRRPRADRGHGELPEGTARSPCPTRCGPIWAAWTPTQEGAGILVTNDDGIHAPGLKCWSDRRPVSDDVWVVAPETEQSGPAIR
jgi:seryl-tRNA synthetase